MDESSDAQAILALAKASATLNKTRRMRAILNEIELAQEAGVSNAALVEALNARGFGLTLSTFETILYRLRKARASAAPTSAPPASAPPAAPDSATDEFAGLEPKQRRERVADKFIRPETTNPLVQSILKERKP